MFRPDTEIGLSRFVAITSLRSVTSRGGHFVRFLPDSCPPTLNRTLSPPPLGGECPVSAQSEQRNEHGRSSTKPGHARLDRSRDCTGAPRAVSSRTRGRAVALDTTIA